MSKGIPYPRHFLGHDGTSDRRGAWFMLKLRGAEAKGTPICEALRAKAEVERSDAASMVFHKLHAV